MLSFVQNFFKPQVNPIGIDFGTDCLRLAQGPSPQRFEVPCRHARCDGLPRTRAIRNTLKVSGVG